MNSPTSSKETVSILAIPDKLRHPKDRRNEILESPLVKLLMDAFPETTLVHVEDK